MDVRRIARVAAVAALTVAVAACTSSTHRSANTSDSVPSTSPVGSSGVTVETSSSPVSTGASTSVTTVPVTVTVAPTTTTTTAGPRPGAVTITYAGSSGGAGEIQVDWNAATGATGYRVYRANSPSGPWVIYATVDVLTGATTVHAGVTNVWGDRQNFWPRPYHGSGASTLFHYVDYDVPGGPHTYFRVVAYNSNGHGPTGATVCAQITMQPAC